MTGIPSKIDVSDDKNYTLLSSTNQVIRVLNNTNLLANALRNDVAIIKDTLSYSLSNTRTWTDEIRLPNGVVGARGISVDYLGNVYVINDASSDRFYIRSNGEWDDGVALPIAGICTGIDVDGDGTVYVVHNYPHAVYQYKNGEWDDGTDIGFLGSGIVIDEDGTWYIPRPGRNLIYKRAADGTWTTEAYPDTIQQAHGITRDSDGNLKLISQNRIYTKTGNIWDSGVEVANYISTVRGLSVDAYGNEYVVDNNGYFINFKTPSYTIETENVGTGIISTEELNFAAGITSNVQDQINTLRTNLEQWYTDAAIITRMSARAIADGTVSDEQFNYLATLNDKIQTILDALNTNVSSLQTGGFVPTQIGDGNIDSQYYFLDNISRNIQTQINEVLNVAKSVGTYDEATGTITSINATSVEDGAIDNEEFEFLDGLPAFINNAETRIDSLLASLGTHDGDYEGPLVSLGHYEISSSRADFDSETDSHFFFDADEFVLHTTSSQVSATDSEDILNALYSGAYLIVTSGTTRYRFQLDDDNTYDNGTAREFSGSWVDTQPTLGSGDYFLEVAFGNLVTEREQVLIATSILDSDVSNLEFLNIYGLKETLQDTLDDLTTQVSSVGGLESGSNTSVQINAINIGNRNISNTVWDYLEGLDQNAQDELDRINALIDSVYSGSVLNLDHVADGSVDTTNLGYIVGLNINAQDRFDDFYGIINHMGSLSGNTITINARRIAGEDVSNSELGRINGLSSNAQDQLDAKLMNTRGNVNEFQLNSNGSAYDLQVTVDGTTRSIVGGLD